MKYSVRKDINNSDRTAEHYWITVNRKNKNNSSLAAVFY